MKRATLFLIITLLFTSCKREAPTEQQANPNGVFVQKMVYVNGAAGKNTPMICVADLYNDNNTFSLFNSKVLKAGDAPKLSDDQSWILYINDTAASAFRMNIDGSNDQKVILTTPGIIIEDYNISPDNSMIAVSVQDTIGHHIGVMPANGGAVKMLFSDSVQGAYGATWFPDSKKIFFSYIDYENRFGHNIAPFAKSYICSINLDGSGLTFISDTQNGLSDDNQPSVSLDGKLIVFISFRSFPGTRFSEVFCMDIDGKNVRRLTVALMSELHTDGPHGDYYDYQTDDLIPLWLKDNEHIMFSRRTLTYDVSIDKYTEVEDIYVVDKAGTPMQNITNSGITGLSKKTCVAG
jgi:Tol biopolymer transport system component